MKLNFILLFVSFLSFVVAQTTLVNSTITANSSSSPTEIVATFTTENVSTVTPTSSLFNSSIPSTTTTLTTTNTFDPASPVQGTGFNPNVNQNAPDNESWLKKHNRFVFIIFVGLIVLALLIWYVIRSVKGMRKRLEQDNAAQLYMMQQASAPQYQYQQQNNAVIPESIQSPPPAYKTRENTPVTNNDQSH